MVAGDGDEPKSFDEAAVRTEEAVVSALSVPSWRFWRRDRDPELRGLFERVLRGVDDARRLRAVGRLDTAADERFQSILHRRANVLTPGALQATVDALEEILIDYGDVTYLWNRLCYEHHLAGSEPGGAKRTTKVTVDDLPPASRDKLKKLLETPCLAEAEVDNARKGLAALAYMRRRYHARHRWRAGIRSSYMLRYLAPLLLVLVGGLGLAAALAAVDGPRAWEKVFLSGISGAVGSSLAALYKLRDEINKVDELRAFRPALLLQPLVGAAAGLVLLLGIESGFLGIGRASDDSSTAFIVAVLAFPPAFPRLSSSVPYDGSPTWPSRLNSRTSSNPGRMSISSRKTWRRSAAR